MSIVASRQDNIQSQRRQRRAIVCMLVVLMGCFIALVGRLSFIHSAHADRLEQWRDAQYYGRQAIAARRGDIFDVAGRVLARSRTVYTAFADPTQIDDRAATAAQVGPMLGMDAGEVEEMLRQADGKRYCVVQRGIEPADAEAIGSELPRGVGLAAESVREYPLGASLGHVLGFISRDGVGLEGMELAYDAQLRCEPGVAWTLRDAGRRTVGVDDVSIERSRLPRNGGHVVLTIDSVLQQVAEEALQDQIDAFEAKRGVAIIMDPHTGDVLAMANYPPMDPSKAASYPPELRRNRAVTDMVEPGSTFKSFVAAEALSMGVTRPDEEIFCHNGLHFFGGRRLHDSHPHGLMTFEQIICKSSNIGMGIVAMRMGNEAVHSIVRRFGFGEPTHCGFPGESEGMVVPLSKWTSYSITSVPMGHEIAVTPIQMISAFCSIANRGVLLRPRMVRALTDADGNVVERFEGPVPVRRVLSTEIADLMRERILVNVVEQGGGHRAALPDYQVFGKTGTAQVPHTDRRGYEPEAYLGSFVGAAPVENPRVAALMMIERPNARIGYYGGMVSAPGVRKMLGASLAYYGVPATKSAQ